MRKSQPKSTRKQDGGRSGAGASNFKTAKGRMITGIKAGAIGENIAETITRPLIEAHFGARYTRISHEAFVVGARSTRTEAWDARCGRHAIDIKTISATATYQKVAIKRREKARKIREARRNGWTSNIVLQRIDAAARTITVFLFKGDTAKGYLPSKSWFNKDAVKLGVVKFDPAKVLG